MDNCAFEQLMHEHKKHQKDLFIRGFLVTNKKLYVDNEFPFFGNWSVEEYGGFYFAAHMLTNRHFYKADDGTVHFLFGHAYDPFSMEYKEGNGIKEKRRIL